MYVLTKTEYNLDRLPQGSDQAPCWGETMVFLSLDAVRAEAYRTIKECWTTTVPDDTVPDGERELADFWNKGYGNRFDIGCDVYLAKDGKKAWARFDDGHGYAYEITEVPL